MAAQDPGTASGPFKTRHVISGDELQSLQAAMHALHNSDATNNAADSPEANERLNKNRVRILQAYVKDSCADPPAITTSSYGTFAHVIPFLEGKTDRLAASAELDWFFTRRRADDVKAKKVSPLVFAQTLLKHLCIEPAIRELCDGVAATAAAATGK